MIDINLDDPINSNDIELGVDFPEMNPRNSNSRVDLTTSLENADLSDANFRDTDLSDGFIIDVSHSGANSTNIRLAEIITVDPDGNDCYATRQSLDERGQSMRIQSRTHKSKNDDVSYPLSSVVRVGSNSSAPTLQEQCYQFNSMRYNLFQFISVHTESVLRSQSRDM